MKNIRKRTKSPGHTLPARNIKNSVEVVTLNKQAAEGEQGQVRVLPDLQGLQVLRQAYQFLSRVDPDTTWSLLVEKTCWRMESLMSGAIPINNFFKLMQALRRRTRRGSLRTGSRRWTAALVPTYYHHQFNLSIFHTCGGIFTGNGFFWSLPKSFNHNRH